jgi:hypothetical protein
MLLLVVAGACGATQNEGFAFLLWPMMAVAWVFQFFDPYYHPSGLLIFFSGFIGYGLLGLGIWASAMVIRRVWRRRRDDRANNRHVGAP